MTSIFFLPSTLVADSLVGTEFPKVLETLSNLYDRLPGDCGCGLRMNLRMGIRCLRPRKYDWVMAVFVGEVAFCTNMDITLARASYLNFCSLFVHLLRVRCWIVNAICRLREMSSCEPLVSEVFVGVVAWEGAGSNVSKQSHLAPWENFPPQMEGRRNQYQLNYHFWLFDQICQNDSKGIIVLINNCF